MSNLTVAQSPEQATQMLENLCFTSTDNESSTIQLDGFIYSWDQFMNELEFE